MPSVAGHTSLAYCPLRTKVKSHQSALSLAQAQNTRFETLCSYSSSTICLHFPLFQGNPEHMFSTLAVLRHPASKLTVKGNLEHKFFQSSIRYSVLLARL
ncbi:hypothetical protein V6N13_020052 [Hibiscus sabdariffa]|uniref:Uncharacterized protein n=1 Tax=Hibiscus sabdariffa TaxID=183260 RepID=A0ABR2EU93_9ROSI